MDASTLILVLLVLVVIYYMYHTQIATMVAPVADSDKSSTMTSGGSGKHVRFLINNNIVESGAADESEERSDDVRGLNELEQNNVSRGTVPLANQPDHTQNLWKCDQSHDSGDLNCTDTHNGESITAEIYTPIRGKAVNQGLGDISDMHMVSRFGTTSGS